MGLTSSNTEDPMRPLDTVLPPPLIVPEKEKKRKNKHILTRHIYEKELTRYSLRMMAMGDEKLIGPLT